MRRVLRAAVPLPLLLAACSAEPEPAHEVVRPVLTVTVEPRAAQAQGFAGTVEPEFSADLAFRMLGRLVARDVEVGDLVKKGATIASIDPTALDLAVQAARADLSSARSAILQRRRQRGAPAAAACRRQHLAGGLRFRQAGGAVVAGQCQSRQGGTSPRPRSSSAMPGCSADFDGVVTAVGAEIGQVVSPARPWSRSRAPDLREAVIDIPDEIAVGLLRTGVPLRGGAASSTRRSGPRARCARSRRRPTPVDAAPAGSGSTLDDPAAELPPRHHGDGGADRGRAASAIGASGLGSARA